MSRSLRKLQEALDILCSTGEFRVTPETLGGYRRSSFIGAMLGLLDGVEVGTRPTVVRLPAGPPRQITISPSGATGYPDPILAQHVDEVGVEIALEHLRERYAGYEVVGMPHANPGFDAKVLDTDGVIIKYVEIKSNARPDTGVLDVRARASRRRSPRQHLRTPRHCLD